MLDRKLFTTGIDRWEPKDIVNADLAFTIIVILGYFLSLRVYMPTQVLILVENLTLIGFIVLASLVFLIPPILNYVIIKVLSRKIVIEEVYVMINCSAGILAWFFISAYPLDFFQLIIYVITILIIYIGVFERFPIIKLNIKSRKLYLLGYDADKELFLDVDLGQKALFIACLSYSMANVLRIYPVPFLLLIKLVYVWKKLFFPKRLLHSDFLEDNEEREMMNKKFYRNWRIVSYIGMPLAWIAWVIIMVYFVFFGF
ncbi:MAG: hypothetical protein ACTSRP_25790 [Candidatus Helarchaeota archaeon]